MDFATKFKGDPMERYQKQEKLGEGTYGIVYKAKDRVDGDVRITKLRVVRVLLLKR